MVDQKLVCTAIIVWGAIACAAPTTTPAKISKSSVVPSTCSFVEKPMISDEITINENTVGTISNYAVGVVNVGERELPDDKGVIAPRISAILAILDPSTKQSHDEDVFAGSVISLGTDRYCVVHVDGGNSKYGSVTLRKIP
ncbi:MAG TPA: hypothetical protein VK203_06375 [Nostocaceae cyanobacterium]|nr:hypothetical protein [Nostocaceae cyanobacterium]